MVMAHRQLSRPSGYRCSICAREFARTEHLVRHRRTHTKEKPFHCDLCSQSFSRRDLLRRHETKSHNDEAPTRAAFSINTTARLPLPVSPPIEDTVLQRNNQSYESSRSIHRLAGNQGPLDPSIDSQNTFHNDDQWEDSMLVPLQQNEFNIIPSIEDCFIPADLGWLDDCLAAPKDTEITTGPVRMILGNQNEKGQSILSRPSSPTPLHGIDGNGGLSCTLASLRSFTISDDTRQRFQRELRNFSNYILPSAMALSRYIERYFRTFHQHMPFLHETAWAPESAAAPLFLAVCANGALYSFDSGIARSLHTVAMAMMTPKLSGICALQTTMLLIAFAAWTDDIKDLGIALQLRGGITLILRQEWSVDTYNMDFQTLDWKQWIDAESKKRVTLCLFTLFNLIQIAYDIPSPLILDDQYGMPSHEAHWRAETQEEWLTALTQCPPQEWKTANGIIEQMGDRSLPLPSNIGMFGCHLIISTLLQKIMLFRQSSTGSVHGQEEIREKYILLLRRWQMMWERERASSLSLESPLGPMLFNGTALLRVSYIRLIMDFSPIRRAFSCSNSAQEIESKINIFDTPVRDPQTTRAALQACLALQIPVRLGFKVIARTSFWIWSVQHALSYFECALLLAKWLQVIQTPLDLSPDERVVLNLARELVGASIGDELDDGNECDLPSRVLQSWARLLDTADTTVWRIQPKLAEVLRLHADKLSALEFGSG